MSEMSEQKSKRKDREDERYKPDEPKAYPVAQKGKEIKEDLDKLLIDIDEILEENAEEFVKSYVQSGGQ